MHAGAPGDWYRGHGKFMGCVGQKVCLFVVFVSIWLVGGLDSQVTANSFVH